MKILIYILILSQVSGFTAASAHVAPPTPEEVKLQPAVAVKENKVYHLAFTPQEIRNLNSFIRGFKSKTINDYDQSELKAEIEESEEGHRVLKNQFTRDMLVGVNSFYLLI